ncbi:MAG TPA: VOC family protein [Candidatus Avipropionibacterium avicola]|uniref:VOC family protein n=1 Tax=Candidatus Avipropionibacterium avicola TaxID=2840701 RepID=A0A9D1GZ91_9ACTN|nr:VOC family protein [Candidatus Avipropionibacterium avicola]
MTSFVSHTTIDATDAYALSQWWKQVLGYVDIPGDPNEPGHEECMIRDPAGRHHLLFIEVPDARSVKNRLHLDLRPWDRHRDAEVERLVGIGARILGDFREPNGGGWVTLADPEGNEFCVLRSEEERAQQD